MSWRSQTSPVEQAVGFATAVQPLAPTAHVPRLALDKHPGAPVVQAFVQHVAVPAAPLQAPLVQVEVVALVQPSAPTEQI